MARKKNVPCKYCGTLVWMGSTMCVPCYEMHEQQRPDPARGYQPRPPTAGVCPACGATFLGRKGKVYCTGRCQRRVNERAKRTKRPARPRIVKPCGTDAAYQRGCRCDPCRTAHNAADRTKTARENRRRARKRATQVDDFTNMEIYERDGWRCHICKRQVLTQPRRKRDPLMASLDHIVPLSQGGTHTRDNVACSHLRCNLRKHARIGSGVQQLLVA